MKKEDIDYSVYLVTDRRNKTDEEFLNIIEELQLSSLDISQNDLSRDGIESFKNLANKIGDRLKIIY